MVLHSPSGFGKSYLVDYVLAQTEGNYSYVVIGRTTKYDGVTYIQQLAGALNDSAEETGRFPTFSQYRDILRSENSDLALQLAQETIEPIGAAISGVPSITVAYLSMV